MKKRVLIISTQLSGGCFQYANSIIKNWDGDVEVVLPKKGRESNDVTPDWPLLFYGYNSIVRFTSFLYSLLRILVGILCGRYSSLVLFGITKWDYYYIKLWSLFKLNSYTVIHDGKMHEGETNTQFQKDMIEIMNRSTHLIFLSEYVKELVKENYGLDKPYHIVPHGLIDYGNIEKREQPDVPTLLFLGRVTKYKGIDTLLSALQMVPEDCYKKLIIAGRWASNMQVPKRTEKIEIINKHLTNDEILKYIRQSDVMVFPYKEATQSGVATLALNYLKPSIATSVGAFREQFTDQSAVFVEPQDSTALANAIETICKDRNLRIQMVDAIIKEKEKFQWTAIAKNLAEYTN